MGLVRRQSIINLIVSYSGILLGAFNNIILFQEFLSREQYGLITLLMTFMVIGTELSQLGVSKIIVRFFPYFADHRQRKEEFVFVILGYFLVGLFLFAVILTIAAPFFQDLYADLSPLFSQYFGYVVWLVAGFSLQKYLSTFSQALLRSVLPNILQQLVQRLLHTLAIVGFFYLGWNFTLFIQVYVIGYYIPVLILLWYLHQSRQLSLRFDLSVIRKRVFRIMIAFGLFTTLTEAAIILVSRVDMAMLGKMLGEGLAGTYALAFFISTLIHVPSRATNAIVIPLLAAHLKKRNLPEVLSLFRKTALNNLVLGGLVFIGIWVNIDPFFTLYPKHSEGALTTVWIGVSALISISTGPSRAILVNSKFYRLDLILNIVLLVLVVLSNLWLIPRLGITGAAIATTGSLALYNVTTLYIIWQKLGIQPFTWRNPAVLLVACLALWIGFQIPPMSNPLLTILINSVLLTPLYLVPVLLLRLAPDLSEMVSTFLPDTLGKYLK